MSSRVPLRAARTHVRTYLQVGTYAPAHQKSLSKRLVRTGAERPLALAHSAPHHTFWRVNAKASRTGHIELGGFRLIRLLGEGAFGSAYLAEQLGTERLAVVKVARKSLLAGPNGKAVKARFAAEARAATRIRHPGLCTVYTVGETSDGVPALAMEFIDGETFRSRLSRLQGKPLPLLELATSFRQLVTVIEVLHAHGVVHCDLSPNNVMFAMGHDGDLQVRVLDFGLAALNEGDAGLVAGTPGYSAPEQFLGKTSPASDLFGLGAMLWWASTGHELFANEESRRIVDAIQGWERGPDASSLYLHVPRALSELIQALLDPTPTKRPALARVREVLDALEAGLVPAPPPSVLVVDPEPAGPLGVALSATLGAYGVRVVVATDSRRVTLGDEKYAAILLSAALTKPSVGAVFTHIREFFPETPLMVVASGVGNVSWDDVPFDARVRLPGGAYRLAELGERLEGGRTSWVTPLPITRPSHVQSNPEARAAYTDYIGGMPSLLLELDDCLARGMDPTSLCERVEQLSVRAGMRNVEKLALTLRLLWAEGVLPEGASFVDDLEAAFVRSVRSKSSPGVRVS
jgi:tRNA A-37 threonylcarbamoyl transferase component Bud32